MKHFLTVLLFCNVISIGIFLANHDASIMNWINYFGVVVFGMYVAWSYFPLTNARDRL